ncbi:hypothetical protein B0A55_04843 [Friedmanniomyces simplex]|uniref:SET domain-containing protein n=1 Tax=Friedmanniomyces simplex TaxID=329884 RepID=A0A4U0X937_9PEZI|nr:hypothetical protein B0A55_04843 [Friedmanniomyces simplex]
MGSLFNGEDLESSKTPLQRFLPLYMIHNTAKGKQTILLLHPDNKPTNSHPLPPKGRAIHTASPIPSGTTIDTSPVLLLSPQENKTHIARTSLYHYTYNWPSTPQSPKTQAVVFGLGSMFNHSSQNQNVGWIRDLERQVIVYRALRDIGAGEELCISYGEHLTFEDADGWL